ncbi:MAG TPA: hypothetical protein VI434_04120 [Candidatus Dormibacteraeota bacterium]
MPDELFLDPALQTIALRYFAAVETSQVPSSLTVANPMFDRRPAGFGIGRALAAVAVFAALCAVLTVVVVVGRNLRTAGPPQTGQGGPSGAPSATVCPSPASVPRNGPTPPRSAAAMAYDDATGQVVLFGGDTYNGKGNALADTWIWNGTLWSQRKVSPSPPGRIGAAMAYDPVTKQVVLFSGIGNDSKAEDDTWVWNGASWRDARPATNPPPRNDAAIAFDPALGKIVMFGGWDAASGGASMDGDTWTWDGTNWTELHPSSNPAPRAGSVMAYDPVSHNLLIFGGDAGNTTSNETWLFNGHAWTRVRFAKGVPQPRGRDSTVMAADTANQTIVLFGGEEVTGPNTVASANDTWTWNGSDWTQAHPQNVPPARGVEAESGMMTYDAKLGVVVLYGGPIGNPQESFGDTWTWNGTNWTEVANNGPKPPASCAAG